MRPEASRARRRRATGASKRRMAALCSWTSSARCRGPRRGAAARRAAASGAAGTTRPRHGRFEEADGGTLFLDELGTLSMPAQDRLLRAVEYGEITRIGASKPMRVDVRIV